MYHSFLIHSSADGHQGGFHVLAIVNSVSVNNGVHVSLSILVSLIYTPSSGIAGSCDSSISPGLNVTLSSDCNADKTRNVIQECFYTKGAETLPAVKTPTVQRHHSFPLESPLEGPRATGPRGASTGKWGLRGWLLWAVLLACRLSWVTH